MECPTELHLLAAKRVLRYLKGTLDFGVFYQKGKRSNLIGLSDSDYAEDLDDRKSTFGRVFMMSSAAVSWLSKKQQVVTSPCISTNYIFLFLFRKGLFRSQTFGVANAPTDRKD